ncbi:YidH family protein [Demequina phytophila]|uniref:YidH family protein n=1 Tax=Demequina phytophila TaxID=1638981 RepID=UPI000783CBCD|nr:DUF202 domain-containing protein [Demequina phytophila]
MADSPGFPRRVYGVGDAPDARFSMANERTYLAWTRTSLALFATGVGLEALDAPIHVTIRLIVAVLFCVLGIVAGVAGLVGWLRAERALRLGTPLPGPRVGMLVTVGAVTGMVLVVVGMVV